MRGDNVVWQLWVVCWIRSSHSVWPGFQSSGLVLMGENFRMHALMCTNRSPERLAEWGDLEKASTSTQTLLMTPDHRQCESQAVSSKQSVAWTFATLRSIVKRTMHKVDLSLPKFQSAVAEVDLESSINLDTSYKRTKLL